MLLFFRVFSVLIASLFRRRIGFMDESVLHLRVWPTDMDLNFHLNDGRYVSLAGLARVNHMARTGLFRQALRRKWYPVVGAVTIRYRREIRAMHKFELRSRCIGWDEKWTYFEHRFQQGENLMAIATARGLLRTRQGPVPTADVIAALGLDPQSPPLPEKLP